MKRETKEYVDRFIKELTGFMKERGYTLKGGEAFETLVEKQRRGTLIFSVDLPVFSVSGGYCFAASKHLKQGASNPVTAHRNAAYPAKEAKSR